MNDYVLFNAVRFTYLFFDERHRPMESYDISYAERFEYDKAENVINNAIPPADRKNWIVMEASPSAAHGETEREEMLESTENSVIMQELKTITEAAGRLSRYLDELDERLSEIDRQQSDVLHFIEQYDLNACDGFKVYKLLKEIRIERRGIKNEMRKAQMLNRAEFARMNYYTTLKKMSEQDKRNDYTPRILTELFDLRKSRSKEFDIERRKIKTGTD